jgi:predicted ATPase
MTTPPLTGKLLRVDSIDLPEEYERKASRLIERLLQRYVSNPDIVPLEEAS